MEDDNNKELRVAQEKPFMFDTLEAARAAHQMDPDAFHQQFMRDQLVVKPGDPQAELLSGWHQMYSASKAWAKAVPHQAGLHDERLEYIRLLGNYIGALYDRQVTGEPYRPLPEGVYFSHYQSTRPFLRTMLDVPGGHRIEVKLLGNPNGLPILTCHPGPGQGITLGMNRLMDPTVWLIVAFGQRGSMGCEFDDGGLLQNNQASDSLADMERVRQEFGITRWKAVYGHCWGATLALQYALEHSDLVPHLLMSDMFYADHAGNEYFFGSNSPGALRYPEAFAEMRESVGCDRSTTAIGYLRQAYRAMQTDNQEEAIAIAKAFFRWQMRICHLIPRSNSLSVADKLSPELLTRVVRLQLHYYSHGCWLPPLKELIQQAEQRLGETRIQMVHAAYDSVCNTRTPQVIAKTLTNVNLYMDPVGGHQSPAAMARIRLRTDEIAAGL